MKSELIQHILRLIFLTLLQVLLLNNFYISGWVNPYIYMFFIMALPVEIPGLMLLLLAFISGFLVDIFTGTLGMHASSMLVIAWCRPLILKRISPRDGYEFGQRPVMKDLGLSWALFYAFLMVLIHHFVLFTIEAGKISQIPEILGKTFSSTLFSVLLIMVIQFFSINSPGKK